jgi:hypothetical protein
MGNLNALYGQLASGGFNFSRKAIPSREDLRTQGSGAIVMGLNSTTIVCPHCNAVNNVTADDYIWHAEIACSKCHGIMGLLRDFVKHPPQAGPEDPQSGHGTAAETPDHPA